MRVHNHGSLTLLYSLTDLAEEWVEEWLPSDRMEWNGAVVVEPRYIRSIMEGMAMDGLDVEFISA